MWRTIPTSKPVSSSASISRPPNPSSGGKQRRLRLALLFPGTLLLAGCVSLETAVPPVATLAAHGRDAATLEAGRRTYLESCTHCHKPEPVREYAGARWPGIIADMSERAKLSAVQQRAVLAYVLAAAETR